MAAIPVVCEFLRMTIIGQNIPMFGTFKWGFFQGITTSIITYAFYLAYIFVLAIVFEFIAPKFGGNYYKS
jgi:hypothetical protein